MFFKFIAYIKFLTKSTNQHGVHSPFVYNLVTKCFYNKEKKTSSPSIISIVKQNKPFPVTLRIAKLLNRLIPYLDCKTVLVLGDSYDTIHQILAKENTISITNAIENCSHYDLIYLDILTLNESLDFFKKILAKTHNDTVIIINSLYESNDTLKVWEKIKLLSSIKVTIDTFHLGFVFLRKEQVKEHFTIRL
ncbi:hypothetical protein [Aquimarina sp. 2201CG5-10]|uniref:hypothetical protein n=1 Tax=Aquimarina callyspongiae TaxID=3098150 RepID=UPI002AB3B064|nr:hypothetical protein [Aquimarina sp. 2201CG5-10]MDY8137848.1 hypothetical protein [Aquimarina sp. 2201CG5-10]